MPEDPQLDELRDSQLEREVEEKERARTSDDQHEVAQHERRAQKARYLRDKLDQRAASEQDRDD